MPRKSSKKSHSEISAFYKEEFLKHKARLEMQKEFYSEIFLRLPPNTRGVFTDCGNQLRSPNFMFAQPEN
jgi:hypothetical protein